MEKNFFTKTSRVYQNRVVNNLFSLGLALLFGVGVYTACNPFWDYSGVDSACFILMGRGLLAGHVPYLSMVDNKGPILYLLNALPMALTGNPMDPFARIAIWILEVIFLFLSLRLISWKAHKLGIKADWIIQLIYLAVIVALIETGNMSEEYSSLFTLASFAVLLHYALAPVDKKFRWQYSTALGAFFVLGFFIRPNNALPTAAIIFVLVIGLLLQKDFRGFYVCAASGIGGGLLVTLPMVGYLAVNGAISDWLAQTFFANSQYAGDSQNAILSLLSSRFGKFFVLITVFSVFGLAWWFFKHRKVKPTFRVWMFFAATTLAVVFSVFSAFLSRFPYLHYLLVGVPPLIVSLLLAMGHFPNQPDITAAKSHTTRQNRVVTWLPILSCFVIGAVFVALSSEVILVKCEQVLHLPSAIESYRAAVEVVDDNIYNQQTEIQRLIAMVPEADHDAIYILDCGTTNASNTMVQGGILPCKRLFIAEDRFRRLLIELDAEYQEYFDVAPPLWLIALGDPDQFPTEHKHDIENKYEFIAVNAFGMTLYRLTA